MIHALSDRDVITQALDVSFSDVVVASLVASLVSVPVVASFTAATPTNWLLSLGAYSRSPEALCELTLEGFLHPYHQVDSGRG